MGTSFGCCVVQQVSFGASVKTVNGMVRYGMSESERLRGHECTAMSAYGTK